MPQPSSPHTECDVILIGAGIMSATLATLLKELQPDLHVEIYERLDKVAAESSDAWNNAGTGHTAFCELNYTPEKEDGSISISKAVKIAESFEISKQFWAYLVQDGYCSNPPDFINIVPHLSAVWGEENVDFLRKRFEALQTCHLFEGMKYTDDWKELSEWMPIMMGIREKNQPMAATRMDIGTDVNFGALTRNLFHHLKEAHGVEVFLQHEVQTLKREKDQRWKVKIENVETEEIHETRAKFVFIGAGGGAISLLDKSDIDEGQGFGGFPVSGQWLVCHNPELIEKHHAKVYGKAAVGAPPMSVPHLDTRIIDGKKALLFGPYAGFSTKFLKEGSYLDLPLSIDFNNLGSMFGAWIHNLPLTKYLIEQVTQSKEDRFEALREFIPDVRMEDWELVTAGQRVQVIKKDEDQGGVLEFGTEVVTAADGSLAALLGASPGASTSVSIMLELLQKCFPDEMASESWRNKLSEMIPSYGKPLAKDRDFALKMRAWSHKVLELDKTN
jgi:malate dehydrogenase (quinone)